jgi:ribosome recycling factor
MDKKIIDNIRPELDKTIDYFKQETSALQAGREMPALLADLEIDCYGQKMPLKQLGTIQNPEPRLIIIQPWDKSILKDIESTIRNSNLDLSPIMESDSIRIKIPSLTEERRRELIKILQEKTEECRISIRRQREDVWKKIQEMEKNKEISEDDKFKAKDELQKVIEEYNKKIEEMKKKKEDNLMKV